MSFKMRIAGAALAAAAASGGLAFASLPASATTLTCTGVAGQTAPPLGCGGDQLAYAAKGDLSLAVLGGNYWNSQVGFAATSVSSSAQDWTVFAVNGNVTDGPGFLGKYVAAYTPDGKFASFTQNGTRYTNTVPGPGNFSVGTNVYCLSVENLYDGPHNALRWHTVLRNCDSNGVFSYGAQVTPKAAAGGTLPSFTALLTSSNFITSNGYGNVINLTFTGGSDISVTGSGVSGNGPSWAVAPGATFTVSWAAPPTGWSWTTDNSVSASRANAYQVWAPVNGSNGLEMINMSLSFDHPHGTNPNNTPYVLDDTAFGGNGTWALAFPENDGLNQQSEIDGCTEPITGLNTNYSLCP